MAKKKTTIKDKKKSKDKNNEDEVEKKDDINNINNMNNINKQPEKSKTRRGRKKKIKDEEKIIEANPKPKRGRKKKTDITDKNNNKTKTKTNPKTTKAKPKNQIKPKTTTKPKKRKSNSTEGYFQMTSRTKLSDQDCSDFLTGECKNNYCKNVHNYSLKNKEVNNQEFARRYALLSQDFEVLEPFERKLFSKANLDLMFIMDCTGSMVSCIETAKKELSNIINFIKENNPYSKIRVSFIGYRDHCDKNSGDLISSLFSGINSVDLEYNRIDPKKTDEYEKGENPGVNKGQFSFINFDENVDKIKYFISKVNAYGGGDIPEDVAGGLKLGLEQDWKSPAKYCVLVTDAPCHGSKYHNLMGDQFPLGDPNGLIIEDLIQEYARRDINFFAVKIQGETDLMFEIMSDKYQQIAKKPITISNMGGSTDKFGFFLWLLGLLIPSVLSL